MRAQLLLSLSVFFLLKCVSAEFSGNTSEERPSRSSKFLPLFRIIRFENGHCSSTDGRNGTCLLAQECQASGGKSSSTCAQGFGVCCIQTRTCGESTKYNQTEFTNPEYPSTYDVSGSCQFTVQKMDSDICQYRLDFTTFVLAPPEGTQHTCKQDQFIVSGGSPVPIICGTNSASHMYIEVAAGPSNPLTMSVVTTSSDGTTATVPDFKRSWQIVVHQISCNALMRAPSGCLQWFQGVTGTLKSFNYLTGATALHLSNQDYTVCVRTERGFCGIGYSVCEDGGFTVSGDSTAKASQTDEKCATDWIVLACASDNGKSLQSDGKTECTDRLCGTQFNSITDKPDSVQVSSLVRPFQINVHFDSTELTTEVDQEGFCLTYLQIPCLN